MAQTAEYDYIIAGQGCAGLSLAVQLSLSGLPFRKVLLVDRESKQQNDRSWCFWTRASKSWYEPIVHRSWSRFRFRAPGYDKVLDLHPYTYKFIRGIDFYRYCYALLKEDARFEFMQDKILNIGTKDDKAWMQCESGLYHAGLIFNSAFRNQQVQQGHINYIQHFQGWVVEADQACFDENCPVFMDFQTEQENDFRFYYCIPYSSRKALIEYTGFSPNALEDGVYQNKLRAYLNTHYPEVKFSINETERGIIPMAESPFVNPFGKQVVNIGTAGGQSKASTGYTFYFIQKQSAEIIEKLRNGISWSGQTKRPTRFMYYDKVLLQVLENQKGNGWEVFRRLFEKNKIRDLLAFLNEESGPGTELGILYSVDKRLFIPAALKKLLP